MRNAEESSGEGTVRFSIREEAKDDIKQILSGNTVRSNVILTDGTPSIMLGHKGVKDLPLAMKSTHIRENILSEDEAKAKGLKTGGGINYHGLGEDLFYKVIDNLNDVTEAYRGTANAEDSDRRENYFLLISKSSDADGNTINIPIYINTKGQYNQMFIDTNTVSTVFGRNNLRDYINKQLNRHNLVRIKRKGNIASERTGPIPANYSNNAFTDIIPDSSANSNTSDEEIRKQERDDDYMEAVESGDTQKAQRMADEAAKAAGYDMHLYHGAKSGGGFTVFKDWQYFTDDKEYAEKYTQRNTSDKSLYDVYVRADRLLDTRKPADRAVYEQYKQEYGMSDLEESGLPSWIDGYDLSEIIDENGLDYDGIILDEGTQYYENGKTYNDKFRRVLSYVIKESSQIKSADTVTYDDNGNLIPLSELFSFIGQLIRTTRLPRGFCYTNPNGRVRKPCRLNKNRNQNAWKTLILL